jgi:hypothetical protein
VSSAGPFSGEPTFCDMNCFYESGHDGPHQKWLGDICDIEGCSDPARWRRGRQVICDRHSSRVKPPEPMANETDRIKQVVWDALVDKDVGMGNPPTEIWNLYTPEGVAIVITSALVKARPWESVVGEGQEGSVTE